MPATKKLLARARASKYDRPYTRSIARVVRSMQETKYVNTPINHSATTTSTTVISSCGAGTSQSTRTGRKVMMNAAELRMNLGGATVRCIVYVPKDASDFISLTNYYDAVDNDEMWVLQDLILDGQVDSNTFNRRLRQLLTIEYNDSTGNATRNPVKLYLHSSSSTTINGHTKMWYKDI